MVVYILAVLVAIFLLALIIAIKDSEEYDEDEEDDLYN